MKIKAAVLRQMGAPRPYAESRPVTIEEVDLAPPGAGEVLVKVAVAGVCHSDLSVVNGNRPRSMPMVLGHEASGVVEAVGDGVTRLSAGDHVVFVFMPHCGACAMCKAGRPSLCATGFATNAAGTLLNGAQRLSKGGEPLFHQVGVSCFAEYAVAHESSLVKVEKNLPLEDAALFSCAVITGVGAVMNTAALPRGATAAVVGLGGTGLAALMGAKAAGASSIAGFDPLPDKRAKALTLGASEAFDPLEDGIVAQVGGYDYVFECAGSVQAMEFAYAITGMGGTTVSSGLSHPEKKISIQHVNLVAQEKTIKGSYLGSCVVERDIPRYIDLFRRGDLPVDQLISRRIGLEDLNEAFDRLADGSEVRQVIVM
ncbi:MAG: alcohol dehydrogenase catalytic domain-containing protein [Rhizobiales bacterium]|nr:alcohol dehydrogenase catalytic domain-containing protein [Hyphomicrobiales bacterium]